MDQAPCVVVVEVVDAAEEAVLWAAPCFKLIA
jgi:hypothetical protein